MLLEFAFWAALTVLAFTYILFPLALFTRAWFFPVEPLRRLHQPLPAVSIIIAARNEAAVLEAKLQSLRRLDYPADRLQVIVVSDGSEDDTVAIAQRFADDGVVVLDQPWLGKAAALERAVERAAADILVFTDANSLLEPGALGALVSPFADDSVGGVAGNQVYDRSDRSETTGERSYWRIDRLLKQGESRGGDVVSATGALYAIRRRHYQGVARSATDDFYLSTAVIAGGQRLVFEPDAVAREPAAETKTGEFARKTRIMTRGLYGVWLRRRLLNPWRYGFYALQLAWHKVLRRVMVVPLIVLFLASLPLAGQGLFHTTIAATQILFYGAAALDFVLDDSSARWRRLMGMAGYFCMVNAASLIAITNLIRGNRIDRWGGGGVRKQPAVR